MTRPFLRHTMLCIGVTLAVFALLLWIAANHEGNAHAAIGAFVCTLLSGGCWFAEWVIRWTPQKSKETEE